MLFFSSLCVSFLFSAYYAQDKLDDFVSTINNQLQPLFMQIRKGMSEVDGRTHYALVGMRCCHLVVLASHNEYMDGYTAEILPCV